MDVFLQQLANGLMSGSIYGLIAVCVALVFGVLGIPQFALGAQAMIAGYLVFFLGGEIGFAGALAVAVLASALIGYVIQRVVFSPLENAESSNLFLAAAGLMFVMQGLALMIFGPNRKIVPEPIDGTLNILGATITWHRLGIMLVCAAAVLCLQAFLKRSNIGRAIRATAQNPKGAKVVGISPRRVAGVTMALGCGLAGLAGGLLAPVAQVYPTSGDVLILKAFIIVAVAGMGSIPGALICGYLVGIAESFGSAYLSVAYHDIYSLILLFLVLIIRPQGLFVREVRKI